MVYLDEKLKKLELEVASLNKTLNTHLRAAKTLRNFGIFAIILGIVVTAMLFTVEGVEWYIVGPATIMIILAGISALFDYRRIMKVNEFNRKFPVTVPDIKQALEMWKIIEEDLPKTENARSRCRMIDQMLEFIESGDDPYPQNASEN